MEYPKQAKLECPYCQGKGHIKVDVRDLLTEKRTMKSISVRNKIRKLRMRLGEEFDEMTLRQIGEQIGIKAPQSVKHHLNMIKKYGWEFEDMDDELGEMSEEEKKYYDNL